MSLEQQILNIDLEKAYYCGKELRAIALEVRKREDRIKRLEEALDTLTLVVGLTPIVGNKDALQEAMDMARAELKAKEAKP